MSQHFEVTELLANENLAALPPTIVSNFYKLFDKCVRVHTPAGGSHRISLIAVPSGYHGEIRACEKTLSIIPSELIGNAMKYSVEGEPIRIQIASHNKKCVVRVSNYAKENRKLDSRVFEKGVSLSDDHDSTGNGLYLVKLVTQQHHGTIDLSVNYVSPGISEVMFTLTFPECG